MNIRTQAIGLVFILSAAFIGFTFFDVSATQVRGIRVIEELSHRSGKLGAYKALIIGINEYADPKIPDLDNAVNDATKIAGLLKTKYGFQFQMLLNERATKKAIYKALRKLVKTSKAADSVLIYFAGHGDLDRTYDDGWWIPADARAGEPVTYFENVQIQKAMRSLKSRHVLLISDSCFSGTLFGKSRDMPPVIDDKYYLSLYNEKSRWGITSGNRTPVSDAGSGGHSVFAYHLIKALSQNAKPFLSTQEVYTDIAPIISNNSEQTPLCRPIRGTGDQGGEFIFIAAGKRQVPPKAEPEPLSTQPKTDPSLELAFWQSIRNSQDPDMFRAYLDEYPDGKFTRLAQLKIGKLILAKPAADDATPRVSEMSQPDTFAPSEAPEKVSATAKLYVVTTPAQARVRILNIQPKFRQGIELEPGHYHIEVSTTGYKTHYEWIQIRHSEPKHMTVALAKKSKTRAYPPTVQDQTPTPSGIESASMDRTSASDHLPAHVVEYVNQIRSGNDLQIRRAAKGILRSKLTHSAIMEAAREELLKGYLIKVRDRYHIDAMAYLCRILGSSGNPRYKATLQQVAQSGTHRKLRKYASKNATFLP
jgi:hypothetical protein